MRKIIVAIFAASMFVCSANAQIKKGFIFLGGDISGSTEKTKTNDVTHNKQSGINISPVFGKAIKENLVLGVNAGVSIFKNDYPVGNSKSRTNAYNAGIFLRKYKNIGAGGFYLFVQGGLGGSYMNQKQEDNTSAYIDKTKRVSVGLTTYPGISYAVSKKLQLETGFNNLLSLNYLNVKTEVSNPVTTTYKTNSFNISSSLNNATSSLYLGFRLLIGK